MNEPYWWTKAAVRQLLELKGSTPDGITQMVAAAYKQYADIELLLAHNNNPQIYPPIRERHERYGQSIAVADSRPKLSTALMYWWTRDDVKTLIASQQRNGIEPAGNIYMMVAAYKQYDDIEMVLAGNADWAAIAQRHERFKQAIERGEQRGQNARGEGQSAHQSAA